MPNIDELIDSYTSQPKQGATEQATTSQPSPVADVDSLIDEYIASKPQVSTGPTSGFSGIDKPMKGAAPLLERMAMALPGTETGKTNYLKERYQFVKPTGDGNFLVGNSESDAGIWDPKGFSGDVLGELSEFASSIPSIVGGLGGAAVGALGGPGTSVISAGVGTTIGRGIEYNIGESLGLGKVDFNEKAVDLAINGALGATGQAASLALKPFGKNAVRKGIELIDDNIKMMPEPQKQPMKKAMAKILAMSSGADENKLAKVFDYGPDAVWAKVPGRGGQIVESGSDEALAKITDDFISTFDSASKESYKNLDTYGKAVISKSKSPVPTGEFQQEIFDSLSSSGIIDADGRMVLTSQYANEFNRFQKLFERFGGAIERTQSTPIYDEFGNLVKSRPVNKLIVSKGVKKPIGELDNITGDLDKLYNDFAKDGSVTKLVRSLRDGNKNEAFGPITKGIRGTIDDIAKELKDGVGEKFIKARAATSNLLRMEDDLASLGIKLSDKPGHKVTIENLVKRSNDFSPAIKDVISRYDEMFKSGLAKRMDIWDVASGFRNSNPGILKFNTIASIAGLGTAVSADDPKTKALGVGGAMLFGTPAGIRVLIQNSNKLRHGLKLGVSSKAKNALAKASVPKSGRVVQDDIKNKAITQTLSTMARRRASSMVQNKSSNVEPA